MVEKARPYPSSVLKGEKSQRTFRGSELAQIAMPMGGIGAGCICLNGHGGLQDFSIRNRPQTTAGPGPADGAFALIHIKGKNPITKLVEGPFPDQKVYTLGLRGHGGLGGGHEGMPRFEQAEFKGEYPFGVLTLSDPKVPLDVTLTGWSPLIPSDDLDSSIPCAILEYTFRNRSRRTVSFEFSYHLAHLPGKDKGRSLNVVLPGAGVKFYNNEDPNAETFGSAALVSVGREPLIKAMWLRGGWFDAMSALWREASTGSFQPNDGTHPEDVTGRNGGSILLRGALKPGASATFPLVIAWHFPNTNIAHQPPPAAPPPAAPAQACATPGCNCAPPPKWHPYYVSQWKDAGEVALYVRKNYKSLRARTLAFKEALFSTTLPSYVLDAVSANIGILKSPTVLRQENGNIWAWEGCNQGSGCCNGTCTHVWNYAQAMPHLFPKLERTLREQELLRSMEENGHVNFRSALPDGPAPHRTLAAADGQLGGIMKTYREWHISGDRKWLQKMYPAAKKSLDYCIATWDPDHKGAVIEPHHNTYDIEFWGPDGMCTSIYLGALVALAEMARDAGHPHDAGFYEELAHKGAYLERELFNGEYYQQNVTFKGLRNTSFLEVIAKPNRKGDEALALVKREGPKYQYGVGCISDGVIGAWMAKIYGIDTPQSSAGIRQNLKAIFEYNFKPDLSHEPCTQRPGYAIGHEPGLLLCSWPRGGKPTLPFVYSDEVWTGIEYQVASHLIEEGFVAEGLTIVLGVRKRYEGRVRNPWNEYECGNYYARAMSSYALLGSLSGFRYSAATRTLWFGPKLKADPFRVFFSAASGFGTITLRGGALTIEMVEGELKVDRLHLILGKRRLEIPCKLTARAGKKATIKIGRGI